MSETHEILKYKGIIEFQVIGNLLNKVTKKLDICKLELNIKKKVYSLMGECLENIDKHAEYPKNDTEFFNKYKPGIEIILNGNYFIIKTQNTILKSSEQAIKDRIEQVNFLDREGLKNLYKKTLLTTEISSKGGAGLGIINMAMISENNLEFQFEHINNIYTRYSLIMKISKQKK